MKISAKVRSLGPVWLNRTLGTVGSGHATQSHIPGSVAPCIGSSLLLRRASFLLQPSQPRPPPSTSLTSHRHESQLSAFLAASHQSPPRFAVYRRARHPPDLSGALTS
ncbi:uncharacterized protein DS421_4g117450 [Arachis hypogaea]|nr:uncharacterized protein DS421_4g117450 [Arachis hypogaea]